jgi:RNA polymerase sigma-70 factor (ECF subfamily)
MTTGRESVVAMPSAALLATLERNRKRVWGLCYRMTGSHADADDLCQETLARAIEREAQIRDRAGLDAWLLRVATTACLDHLRRERRGRGPTELVDPLPSAEPVAPSDPERALILRDDVRFAVVVALQRLPARQRAALVLHDVLDRPLVEVAEALGTNANNVKSLLARARTTLARARVHVDVDVPADRAVVDRVVAAIEARSVEAFTLLLAADVWGVTDGGRTTRPVFGARAVGRLWAAANRREPAGLVGRVRRVNGEPAVVVSAGSMAVASIHVETRDGLVVGLRVIRDPRKLARLGSEAA